MGGLNSFATQTMIGTGLVLLLFIIFHILDLTQAFRRQLLPSSSTARFTRT